MALKSRRRNKKTTQKNVLSVKMQSQQSRRERLRWLRSFAALVVAIMALVLGSWFGGGFALKSLQNLSKNNKAKTNVLS